MLETDHEEAARIFLPVTSLPLGHQPALLFVDEIVHHQHLAHLQ
jgi:hypothetical protein